MTPQLTTRLARPEDWPWVQERYAEQRFTASTAQDTVLLADVDGERAGLGRLVPLSTGDVELGGLIVFERFRRGGIARALVEGLLAHGAPSERVFCIPFAHLLGFYASFGFVTIETQDVEPPAELVLKLDWCAAEYKSPTRLLVLKTP